MVWPIEYAPTYLSGRGQTLVNRTKPGPSFQVEKQLLLCCILMLLLNKSTQLKIENPAQTAFRFSPVRYRAPRSVEKLLGALAEQVLMEVDINSVLIVSNPQLIFNNISGFSQSTVYLLSF